MNCKMCRNQMMEIISGELRGRKKVRLERHLEQCPTCRSEYETLAHTLETTRSVQEEIAPPDHLDRILVAHAREHVSQVKQKPVFFLRPLPAVVALASMVLVFTTVYLNRVGSPMALYDLEKKQTMVSGDAAAPAPQESLESKRKEDTFKHKDKNTVGGSAVLKEETSEAFMADEDDSGLTIHRYKVGSKSRDAKKGDAFDREKSSEPAVTRQARGSPSLPAPEPDRTLDNVAPVVLSGSADTEMEVRDNADMPGEGLAVGEMEIIPVTPEIRFAVPAGATLPEIVHSVDPVYPPSLKKLAVSGVVIVETVIKGEGGMETTRVISSDHEMFTAAVVEALAQWQFKPARLNGEPVDAAMTLTVVFGDR